MLIILEGTDCAGKTTLADALEEQAHRLDVTVTRLRAGPPTPGTHPLAEYELGLRPYRDEILTPDRLILIDRWHLGELVYGPMLRGVSRLSAAQFEHLERFMDALGAIRVVVFPPSERALRARISARGDDLVTVDQAIEALRHFHALAVIHRWRQLVSPPDEEQLGNLLLSAAVARKTAARLAPFPGYVGSLTPLVLLVGDEPNGHVAGSVPNPAFMPWQYNSGHFLLDTIMATPALQPHVQPYGLANANDGTNVHELWDVLGRPRVVALGARAKAKLDELDVPATRVKHPQWVRRFGYRDQHLYGYSLAT